MTKAKSIAKKSNPLKSRAEKLLSKKGKSLQKTPTEDVQKLVHELQGHQIELEMQNEELRKAQVEIEESRRKYSDLYDFAPIGYFTFDRKGMILEANLTGPQLLGVERSFLVKKPFRIFVDPEFQDAFFFHRDEVFKTGLRRTCELKLNKKDGPPFYASLETIAVKDSDGNFTQCRSAVSDITERKQAEQALRRYEFLADQSRDMILFMRREDGQILEANAAAVNAYGYTREELLTLSIQDLRAAGTRGLTPDQMAEADARGILFETVHQRKDGSTFPVEVSSRGATIGSTRALISVVRDITKRKRVEEALQRSQQLFSSIFRLNPAATILSWWADGRCVDANEAYAKLVGYTREELIGKTTVELDIWTSAEERQRVVTELAQKGHLENVELTLRKKNGELINTVAGGETFVMDGQRYILSFFFDITERKKAENMLRESEAIYRTLVETTDTGYVIIDTEGRVIDANAEYVRFTGHTGLDEIRGRTVIEWTADYEKEKNAEAVAKCARDGYIRNLQIDYIDKYGTITPVEINATIVEKSGTPLILALCRDIMERKRAEEEKRRMEERLQRSEKMEALGQLAGGVAHDLNNVLGIVVGYAELVLMQADESSSIRPHLVNIMKGGQRAAAIVDDLLTLARRGVSGISILNLNKIITDCKQAPEFEKLSSHHPSVKIKTDLDPDLLNISGSSVHLGKTLFNLVSNACEAMSKGGIVTIRTANQYLDKAIHGYDNIRSGDYAVLSVSDTGEGISASDLKRIFEPFYTKKVMGRSGTGLGLAVVWSTVKDHSGYIDVWSEEGKGSIFTLYFPVTREEIFAEAVAIAISEYMGKGESILVVDDVKEQCDLASGMLRTLNYNVSSVSSGEEAVAYLKEHMVDLIVLDMIMDPGMDGLDTYRSILAIHPKQKAIIVSGFSESDRVHAAQSLGAGVYVRKPYIKEKLGLAVRKALDKK